MPSWKLSSWSSSLSVLSLNSFSIDTSSTPASLTIGSTSEVSSSFWAAVWSSVWASFVSWVSVFCSSEVLSVCTSSGWISSVWKLSACASSEFTLVSADEWSESVLSPSLVVSVVSLSPDVADAVSSALPYFLLKSSAVMVVTSILKASNCFLSSLPSSPGSRWNTYFLNQSWFVYPPW